MMNNEPRTLVRDAGRRCDVGRWNLHDVLFGGDGMNGWRNIPGYSGYQASCGGVIRSMPRTWNTGIGCREHQGIEMPGTLDATTGYFRVKLRVNGKGVMRYVHRLVALAFIPNPGNLPQVNHIDGDKTHNAAENLEWCSAEHNVRHAFATGLNSGEKMKGKKNAKRSA
jgi:hypothetical protein